MSLRDSDILELNELCHGAIEQRLTAAEQARLAELLSKSEEARRFYLRYMGLSASLFHYAGELQTESPQPMPATGRVFECRGDFMRVALASLAAAAAVALIIWSLQLLRPSDAVTTLENEKDTLVARVTGAKDCQWTGPIRRLEPGDSLKRGQRLELAGGVAEIMFDSGAQLLLVGPAVMDLNSAWEATLHRGTLRATIPNEAIGFRIANPTVEIVDLGTEFSLVVDEAGATEVFVHKGAVEAAPRESQGQKRAAIVLREKQSRRFARTGISQVGNSEQKFTRLSRKVAVERFFRPANYVHWSFDAARQIEIPPPPESPHVQFEDLSGNEIVAPNAAGRWREGLLLDGQKFAKSKTKGHAEGAARTILFWINVPPDAPLGEAGPIVAWQASDSFAGPVQVTWNRNPGEGALGAIRTELQRGFIVGATSLRDGRWHHIALVFIPGQRPNTPTQVKQYVDGRLEGVTAKHLKKRRAVPTHQNLASSQTDLWWIGGMPDAAGKVPACFRGAIDELFVFDRALTPAEIRHLMKENTWPQPPSPSAVNTTAAHKSDAEQWPVLGIKGSL